MSEVLSEYSSKELAEIYVNINRHEWDYRLGNKPKGFDEMPDRCNETNFSRYYFLKSYYSEILSRTSEYERSRAWHLIYLKESKLSFLCYWIFRRWFGLRRI